MDVHSVCLGLAVSRPLVEEEAEESRNCSHKPRPLPLLGSWGTLRVIGLSWEWPFMVYFIPMNRRNFLKELKLLRFLAGPFPFPYGPFPDRVGSPRSLVLLKVISILIRTCRHIHPLNPFLLLPRQWMLLLVGFSLLSDRLASAGNGPARILANISLSSSQPCSKSDMCSEWGGHKNGKSQIALAGSLWESIV